MIVDRLLEFLSKAWGVREFYEEARAAHWFWSTEVAARSLAALWLVVCAGLVSMRVTHWLVPPRVGLALRYCALMTVGLWLSSVGFHGLLALHAFHLPVALLVCTVLAGVALRAFPATVPLDACLRREARAARALLRLGRRRGRLTAGIFAGFAGVLALRALIVPPLGWDAMTYHGPRAARWLQTGDFTFEAGIQTFDSHRHMFAGGDVLLAWALLPMHSDLFANLVTLLCWFGVGLSGLALARVIGLREPYASGSACVVMFAPPLQLQVCSGYVEAPLTAALLSGVALALSCLRRPQPGAAVLAAMALGVALAIKVQALLPAALVGTVLAARLLWARRSELPTRLATLALASGCALLPVLPFLLRALADTGYPLSPLPIRAFGLTLGVASPTVLWYQDRPQLTPMVWPAEERMLLRLFGGLDGLPHALGSMALLPWLMLPLGVLALARRRPLMALALGAAATAPALVHFSGELVAVRLRDAGSAARHLIPGFALAVPASLAFCRRKSWLSSSYHHLLGLYPLLASFRLLRAWWAPWETREVAVVAALLMQAGVLVAWTARRDRRLAAALGLCLIAAGSGALQLRRDRTRPVAYTESMAVHHSQRFWAGAVRLVDEPERPRRLAITSGPLQNSDNWFQYFFLGSRLQNTVHYVVPTRSGQVAHVGPGGDLPRQADYASWLARLGPQGITEVITFKPRSIEQGWMDTHPEHFQKLAGAADWGLYRLMSSRPEPASP